MFIDLFHQLAKLSPEDMKVVNNMRMLEGSSASKKAAGGGFSLKFDAHKVNSVVIVLLIGYLYSFLLTF